MSSIEHMKSTHQLRVVSILLSCFLCFFCHRRTNGLIHQNCRKSYQKHKSLSEDEIENFISRRRRHQLRREFDDADRIKAFLETHGVIVGRTEAWKFRNETNCKDMNALPLNAQAKQVLELVRSSELCESFPYKSVVVEDSIEAVFNATEFVANSLSSLKRSGRLQSLKLGRKLLDAFFDFSLAGCTNAKLFEIFEEATTDELIRLSKLSSADARSIHKLCEELAACGVRNQSIFRMGADIMKKKLPEVETATMQELRSGSYYLLNEGPMMWLSRAAARNHKVRARFPRTQAARGIDKAQAKAATTLIARTMSAETESSERKLQRSPEKNGKIDISHLFADPTLPLIIDLGCGFGLSLLGLADISRDGVDEEGATDDSGATGTSNGSRRPRYNCLGCDLSRR